MVYFQRQSMKVTITSFSYKRGLPEDKMAIGNIGIGNIPTLATFDMFDCRAMPNPYWNESLCDRAEWDQCLSVVAF